MNKKKPEDEQHKRMRLYEQSFHAHLVAVCKRDLQQAQEDGDIFLTLCIQAQLDHYGPVIIDGSTGYLALPERIEGE